MTYNDFITDILNKRGRFVSDDEYHEKHHITPRCLNGTDDEDNLIDLYAREHFIAHKLLAEENPNNEKLTYAWWMMSNCLGTDEQARYELTPEEYESARIAFAKIRSEQSRGENNNFYGKHHTEETKAKMKEKHYDASGENNPMYGKGYLLSGEKNGMYGVHRYGESSPNYGNKWTEKQKQRMSQLKKGQGMIPIYCLELNEEFAGLTEVYDKYGIRYQNISACLNGKQKTAGKHPITGERLHWVKLENN